MMASVLVAGSAGPASTVSSPRSSSMRGRFLPRGGMLPDGGTAVACMADPCMSTATCFKAGAWSICHSCSAWPDASVDTCTAQVG